MQLRSVRALLVRASKSVPTIYRRHTHSAARSTKAIVTLASEMFQLPNEQLWKGYYNPDNVAFHIKTSDDLITMLNCVKDDTWKKHLVRRIPTTKLNVFFNELKSKTEKNQIKQFLNSDATLLDTPIKKSSESAVEKTNQQSNILTFGIFDPREPSQIKILNEMIENQIEAMEEKHHPHKKSYEKMTAWLEKYINNPAFYNLYTCKRSKELIAEATFWIVNLGLDKHIENMSYSELKQFQPFNEKCLNNTSRSQLIREICSKLTKPDFSHEASYALQQGALIVYAHKHTFEKLEKDEKEYDPNNNNKSRSFNFNSLITYFRKRIITRNKTENQDANNAKHSFNL